jgi:hypothetical protein
VAGWLSDDLLTAFPPLMSSAEPVTTVLYGSLPDQAALAAVLDRLDELGIEIIDMTKLPEARAAKRSGRGW